MSEITVYKKSDSPILRKKERVVIVGQRSWIAPHLFRELESRDLKPEYMMKSEVGDEPLRGITMYLIAGVARPTRDDMDREIDLCERAMRTGAMVKYLSSCAVDRWEADSRTLSPEGESYVLGKRQCESIVTGGPSGCGNALRAPVIFGPGQRLESDMLLPTIIRHAVEGHGTIRLNDPFRKFQMVHVADLVKVWAEYDIFNSFPVMSLYTDPEISPIELVDLAAPGHSVFIPPGWAFHKDVKSDRDEIYHVGRANAPFRRSDVVSTVQWYIDEAPQLVAPGTLLLEG